MTVAENAHQGTAGEVFRTFFKLGLTSFGGPIAHLGYFRDELVVRRKWIDEEGYEVRGTIILVAESDAALVEVDEPAVRDRDLMRVGGQVGEYCIRPCERCLDVDHPTRLPDGSKVAQQGPPIGEAPIDPKKVSRPPSCSATSPVRNRRRNSFPQRGYNGIRNRSAVVGIAADQFPTTAPHDDLELSRF